MWKEGEQAICWLDNEEEAEYWDDLLCEPTESPWLLDALVSVLGELFPMRGEDV